MLVQLLRSHPDICSHSEVLSGTKITGITGTYFRKIREQPDFLDRLTMERDRDPVKFLYKIVLDLQGKKVVGFKLKHDELVLPEYKRLRDEIVNDLDFRIIHLRRQNLLRRYLSWYIANNVTHVTLAVEGDAIPDIAPVKLDARECHQDFETAQKRDQEFRQLLAQHRNFSITYEEIVTGESGKLASLLDFLGVSQRKLTTTTKKLGGDSLRRAIVNFDELRSYFAGSPFAEFFEEP
jgi:LPS sulfotransferase NodH